MSFGDFIRHLRVKQGKTLRQFCREHNHDPSNWSKIERGTLSPPKDAGMLKKWAGELGISEKTTDWDDYMIEAAISRGEIPAPILADKGLLAELPDIFRSLMGHKPLKQMKKKRKKRVVKQVEEPVQTVEESVEEHFEPVAQEQEADWKYW
jgi:transcriptional regulator with XRE-family HTH domain